MFRLCPRRRKNKVNGSWLKRESRGNSNEGLLNGFYCVFLRILVRIPGVCLRLNCLADFDMMKAAGEGRFVVRVETGFSWRQRARNPREDALSVSMDKIMM